MDAKMMDGVWRQWLHMGGEHLGERVLENRELNVQDTNK
jgi:hypothetical protein